MKRSSWIAAYYTTAEEKGRRKHHASQEAVQSKRGDTAIQTLIRATQYRISGSMSIVCRVSRQILRCSKRKAHQQGALFRYKIPRQGKDSENHCRARR